MKSLFSSYLKPIVVEDGNGNVWEMSRCVVDNDVIEKYKNNKESRVKFIFFDYPDISFDPSVTEIHKFKSRYRGNSYIRIPLMVIKDKDEKYAHGFKYCMDGVPDGYAVISKLDLITDNKKLKTASKSEKEKEGLLICMNKIYEYNSLLLGDVFLVRKKDINGKYVFDDIVFGFDKCKNLLIDSISDKLDKTTINILKCTQLSTY